MTFTPAAEPSPPARPKWLTLCAAGVIVVAVFAILGGLSALGGLVFSRFHPFAGMPGAPPEMARMVEFQQKMLSGPAPALSTAVGVLGIAVGAWAIHSAVRLLGAKPLARAIFLRAVATLGAVEIASMALGVWMQITSYRLFGELTETFFSRIPTSGSGSGFEKTFEIAMKGGVIVGVVLALGFGLLKLGFLAWSFRYATSRDVVAHLDRPA